ncbi:MAG: hypothetical protein ABI612_15765 [Betaproteobacteria bacterium]
MSLPNGVDPTGQLQPTCPSATFMGNRGILHGDDGVIAKPWQHRAWVTCVLDFHGRNRNPLMRPHRYSELFFLDEATAFAAGHRPCGECRRADYVRFKAAWLTVTGVDWKDVDKRLHAERATALKQKRTYRAEVRELPSGVMFLVGGGPRLKWRDAVLRWSPTGYSLANDAIDAATLVDVLTPASVVEVIASGFAVQVHASAEA